MNYLRFFLIIFLLFIRTTDSASEQMTVQVKQIQKNALEIRYFVHPIKIKLFFYVGCSTTQLSSISYHIIYNIPFFARKISTTYGRKNSIFQRAVLSLLLMKLIDSKESDFKGLCSEINCLH